jgi:hypothetical protein
MQESRDWHGMAAMCKKGEKEDGGGRTRSDQIWIEVGSAH